MIVPKAAYMQTDISAAFASLSAADKETYFSLHSNHNQPASAWPSQIHASVPTPERARIAEQHAARLGSSATLISVFQTNCMEMGNGAAVFARAARLNHSCVPNACFHWNAGIARETVHAMRDIEAGEEVLVSYVDVEHDKRLRAWELRHYGFVCACVACGDEDDVSS